MTAQSKAVIKSYFQTGDRPTQQQFANLIDSYLDASEIHFATDVVADGTQLTDVNITNGQAVASSILYDFTSADVGATFVLTTASFGSTINGTILSVSGGNATLSVNWAGGTISANTGRMTFYHTNNTSAIQAQIDAIVAEHADTNGHNMIGFRFMLPDGVIAVSKITIPRFMLLCSTGGPQATTIFCISGTNDNCVESENYSTLTGTGAVYGTNANVPAWMGVQDIHIDGNRGGNSSGSCLALYGNASKILGDNMFENGASDNIRTEAAGGFASSATNWRTQEEGYFEQITSRNSGAYGWRNRGPHDSLIVSYTAYNNVSWNYRSEGSGTTYTGTAQILHIHTYASVAGTDQYYGAGSVISKAYSDFGNVTLASGCHFGLLYQIQCGYQGLNALDILSTANYTTIAEHSMEFLNTATSVVGINIASGGGAVSIGQSQAAISGGGAAVTFYKIRSGFVLINANMSNASGAGSVGLDISADDVVFNATGFNCATGILWTGGSRNFVRATFFRGSGTAELVGTPNSTNFVSVISDQTSFNKIPLINVPMLVQDTSANTILTVSANVTNGAATGIGLFPGLDASVQNPEWYVRPSSRADCGQSWRFKGDPPVPYGFHASTSAAASLALFEKGDGNHIKLACPTSVPTTYSFTFPSVLGNTNDVLYHTTGGVFTNGRPITVAHALANFTTGVSAAMVKNDGFSNTIVRNAQGIYDLVLSIPTLDAASIVQGTGHAAGAAVIISGTQTSAGGIRLWAHDAAGSATDPNNIAVAVFGSP